MEARWSQLLRDVALWLVLAVLVLAESLARGDPWWVPAVGSLVLAGAMLVRRSHPLVALAVVGGLVVVHLLVGLGTNEGVPVAYAPVVSWFAYVAGRRSSSVRAIAWLVVGELLALLALGLAFQGGSPAAESILTTFWISLLALVFVVLPWLVGRYRSQRDMLVSAGWERAERMEREQRMAADEARLRERSRIAEDMHDSVGHELSLIALRAGALELDPDLDEQHRRAATELREAAAAATDRLGEIIGVLRDGDAPAPTRPAHESIAELVDRAAQSGLAVRLVRSGAGDLAPMVDRAAHRVVQEALTNAAKHAPGSDIVVRLSIGPEDVEVSVTNDPATRPAVATAGGRGLAGLGERVRLAGGTLSAGPRDGGGYAVLARMPRAGGPPEPGGAPEQASRSADELASVQRTARRGLVTAVGVPVGLAALLGAVALVYYLVVGYSAVLEPEVFEQLRVGQTEAEVEPMLPWLEMVDPPAETTVPYPAGSSCRFYRSGGPFETTYAHRLCFAAGRLVAKDQIQTGTVPIHTDGEEPAR